MKLEQPFVWVELLPTAEEEVSGTLADFLSAVVARQPKRRLPPLPVLKDILSRGSLGGGMGGGLRWDASSFSLHELPYSDLAVRLAGARIEDACPAQSVEEWRAWCAQCDRGIDYAQHLSLLCRLRVAEQAQQLGADSAESDYAKAVADYLAFMSVQSPGRG
jgi:hypothetical protein